jgi:hypothetical protein
MCNVRLQLSLLLVKTSIRVAIRHGAVNPACLLWLEIEEKQSEAKLIAPNQPWDASDNRGDTKDEEAQ